MKRFLLLVLLGLVTLLTLSCSGSEGGELLPPPAADPTDLPLATATPQPEPASWPLQRHPSMEQWDQVYAGWVEEWKTSPTALPLVEEPIIPDMVWDLAEEASVSIPPTPLARPFQTPEQVKLPPFYSDPAQMAVEQGEQGIRRMFIADDSVASSVHWLYPGETFAGWMFLGHYIYPPTPNSAQGQDFRLLCLLDYEQIPFKLDGVEGLTHDFHMGPNEERAFRIEIPDLSQGFHSLLCPYYTHPDAFPSTWDEPSYEDWFNLWDATGIGIETILLVGQESPPQVDYAYLPGSQPAAAELYEAVSVNRSAAEEDAWRDWMPEVWEQGQIIEWGPVEAAPGGRLEAVLRANNPEEDPFCFGVTAFLDYQQIPLQEGGELVSWYELAPEAQEVLPLSFRAPQEPGPHVYFIVKFHAPYELSTLHEWKGNTVEFPWINLDVGTGTPQPWFVPNVRHRLPTDLGVDRVPLWVRE